MRGRGQVVLVIAAFLCLGLTNALIQTYSLFALHIHNAEGWSLTPLSSGYSLTLGMVGVALPGVGWLLDRHGPQGIMTMGAVCVCIGLALAGSAQAPWQFIMAFGVFVGSGTAILGLVTHTTIFARVFGDSTGEMLGYALSGIGVGPLVLAPALEILVERVGWRETYVICAIVAAGILVPLVSIAYPRELSIDRQDEDREQVLSLGSRAFFLVTAAATLNLFALFSISFIAVPFLYSRGIGTGVSSKVIAISGLGMAVGFPVWGRLSDRWNRAATHQAGAFLFVVALVFLAMSQPSAVAWSFLFGACFGLSFGAQQPILTMLVADLWGRQRLGLANGIVGIASGLGAGTGGFVGPAIAQARGYVLAMGVSGSTAIVATMLVRALAQQQRKG
jgi:MFS family permease